MAREDHAKTIAKGSLYLVIGMFVSKVLTYLYRILIARHLGAAEYGLFALGFSLFTVPFVISQLGIPNGINRYVAKYRGAGDDARVRGTYLGGIRITLPLAVAAAAAIIVLAPFLSTTVFNEPRLTPILRLFAAAVPLKVFLINTTSVFQAFKRMDYYAYIDLILQSAVVFGIGVPLVLLGYGVFGAVAAWVLSFLAAGIAATYLLETRVFPMLTGAVQPVYEYRELLHYSWPLLLSGVIGMIMGQVDTLMVGFFKEATDVGLYDAAFTTAQVLPVVGMSIGMITFPMLSERLERGEPITGIINTAFRWAVAFTLPAALLFVLFADSIITFLFGHEFTGGATVLGLIAVAMLIRSVSLPVTKLLNAHDRTRLIMWNNVIGAGLNVPLNLVLIPTYGIFGAAIATTIASVTGNVLGFVEVVYLLKVRPRFSGIAVPLIGSVTAAAAVYAATNLLFPITPFWALVPAGIAFAALYLAVFILLGGFHHEDIVVAQAIERRLGIDLTWLKRIVKRFE